MNRDRLFNRFTCETIAKETAKWDQELLQHLRIMKRLNLRTFEQLNQNSPTIRKEKLQMKDWLQIDDMYELLHPVRASLYERNPNARSKTIDPNAKLVFNHGGRAGIDTLCKAGQDFFDMAVQFLCGRYPEFFELTQELVFRNKITGDEIQCPVAGKDCPHGIKLFVFACLQIQEDVNILLPADSDDPKFPNQHYLAMSFTTFGAGLDLRKIDSTMIQLHKPVPLWYEKLAFSVEKRLRTIGTGYTPTGRNTIIGAMNGGDNTKQWLQSEGDSSERFERMSVFPQIDDQNKSFEETICITKGEELFPDIGPVTPANVLLRRERQTFRRLPSVNGIVFVVHTYLVYLDELKKSEVEYLAEHVLDIVIPHAAYKTAHKWFPALKSLFDNHQINIHKRFDTMIREIDDYLKQIEERNEVKFDDNERAQAKLDYLEVIKDIRNNIM